MVSCRVSPSLLPTHVSIFHDSLVVQDILYSHSSPLAVVVEVSITLTSSDRQASSSNGPLYVLVCRLLYVVDVRFEPSSTPPRAPLQVAVAPCLNVVLIGAPA